MAAAFIIYDKNTDDGRDVRRGMEMIQEGIAILKNRQSIRIQQRDGDGSSAAHYDLLASQGSFQAGDYADANTAAKASFDEMDSMLFKLTTNGSVDNVDAAIKQCAAKHGV